MRLSSDASGNASDVDALTLRFKDAESERAFRRDYARNVLPMVRFALLLGLVMYVAFGALDLLVAAANRTSLWLIRYGLVSPVLAAALVGTYLPGLRSRPQLLAGTSQLAGGLGILAMIGTMSPPVASDYYAGLLLVLVFGYTVAQQRFIYATSIGIALLAAYEVVALGVLHAPWRTVANNTFFFVGANALGMFAAYFLELHRRRAFQNLQTIHRDKQRLTEANARLEYFAKYDMLTGLLNRRTLTERLKALAQRSVAGVPVSAVLIDLDNFKAVNDTHGHAAGDNLLGRLGHLIRSSIRGTDAAFRLGGDEFLVLLPECGVDQACRVARHLAGRMERAVEHLGYHDLGVGCSVGVTAILGEWRANPGEILAEVDALMYKAKQAGKSRLAFRDGRVESVTAATTPSIVALQQHASNPQIEERPPGHWQAPNIS